MELQRTDGRKVGGDLGCETLKKHRLYQLTHDTLSIKDTDEGQTETVSLRLQTKTLKMADMSDHTNIKHVLLKYNHWLRVMLRFDL